MSRHKLPNQRGLGRGILQAQRAEGRTEGEVIGRLFIFRIT